MRRLPRLLQAGSLVGSRTLKLVAFGDSVTEGWTRARTLEPDIVYHARVAEALEARHPGLDVTVTNAGVAGDTATESLERLERDVVGLDPDLVVVGFGLNDAVGMRGLPGAAAGLEGFGRALGEIVRRIQAETAAAAVLLTPNFMATDANPNVDPEEQEYLPVLRGLQTNGVVAAYAGAVRRVAAARGVPVADVYAAWDRLAVAGRDTNTLLSNGLNHPGAEGHQLTAELVIAAIDEALAA